MIKIYPAGPIQGKDILETIRNINQGLNYTALLREQGFAPFPVFSDFMDIMRTKDVEITGENGIYEQSLAWMKHADALLMLPGWLHSRGAQAEKEKAKEWGIPVYLTIEELLEDRPMLG